MSADQNSTRSDQDFEPTERRPDVLVYEDDRGLAEEIVLALAGHGLAVAAIADESDLRWRVEAAQARLLILDRMVFGRDSLAIVESLRSAGRRVPVLVVSSLASVDDRIRGLKAGGDDYLVKPFAMGELIARADALLRRADETRQTRLVVGPLVLDLIERSATRGDREIALLPREFTLLQYLMRHAGQTVTRSMLLEDVWNFHAGTETNVVDVHVGNLRRKVDAKGEAGLISNVRGVGFRLAAEET